MKPSFTTILIQKAGSSGLKAFRFSFISYGIPYYFALSYFIFYLRYSDIKISGLVIFFIYLAVSWSWIGPLCIWHYEMKVIPKFWNEAANIFFDLEDFAVLQNQFNNSLLKRYWYFIMIWITVVLIAFFSVKYFMKAFGLYGISDIAFWPWLIGIAFLAFLNGFGFAGVFNSINIITKIADNNFILDQYHYDGRGGLSCIGQLMLSTLILFSSGFVFIPILLSIANYQGLPSSSLVFLLIFLFSTLVVISFMYPLYIIHIKAKNILYTKHLQFKKDVLKLLNPKNILQSKDFLDQIRILNFRNMCVDILRMGTFPINTRLLAELIFFAFLPFVIVLLQKLFLYG